jgi:hypothetical protein
MFFLPASSLPEFCVREISDWPYRHQIRFLPGECLAMQGTISAKELRRFNPPIVKN